jgi:DNA-binding beta-propeller fold protein YncE
VNASSRVIDFLSSGHIVSMNNSTFAFGVIAVIASASLAGPACAGDYQVVRSFEVAGGGGWDYLTYDAIGHRLFIARADRVQVVDPVDGSLIAEIPGTAGVHGVALAQRAGKGYASSGRANSIAVFDLKTLQVTTTIATPESKNPDFIAYDEFSNQVVAFNGGTSNASVIDVAHDRVAKTIALSGKPEAAVSDGRGRTYVNIEDKNEIAVLDLKKGSVVSTIPLAGCDEPAGLAIDAKTRHLFVGCHNNAMLVVAIDSRVVIASLPIGAGVDANAFDPVTKLAFSSQGDGTLTVVRESSANRYEVAQSVTTVKGARTMALNTNDHDVYTVSAEFDEAPPVEGQTRPRRTVRPGTFKVYVLSNR